MSNRSPSDEGGESFRHPAQEWLEEDDELDMDYHSALEGQDEEDEDWEDDDDGMGLGIADGANDSLQPRQTTVARQLTSFVAENPHINLGSIHIELTADDPPEGEETGNADRRRHGRSTKGLFDSRLMATDWVYSSRLKIGRIARTKRSAPYPPFQRIRNKSHGEL
jgi:hypothetical protein